MLHFVGYQAHFFNKYIESKNRNRKKEGRENYRFKKILGNITSHHNAHPEPGRHTVLIRSLGSYGNLSTSWVFDYIENALYHKSCDLRTENQRTTLFALIQDNVGLSFIVRVFRLNLCVVLVFILKLLVSISLCASAFSLDDC